MLLSDVQEGLLPPKNCVCNIVKGTYEYYHYKCDGFNDIGWGCGYRTLQTMCSWINFNSDLKSVKVIPSLNQIQEGLVNIGDKPHSFLGSKQWIGSFEICLFLDYYYNISSKILHARNGSDVASLFEDLVLHFQRFGSPCMIGGDNDAASKTLLGVGSDNQKKYYLILDPHFSGKTTIIGNLQKDGWIQWKDETVFLTESFYNFCLPQCKPTSHFLSRV